MEELKLLKQLYEQRFLGYKYFNDIKSTPFSGSDLKDMPESLDELQSYISDCSLCNLSKSRKKVVFGEGNSNADVMFVGEAPGELEDDLGRVFVGRAGETLDRIIQNVLLMKREDVYIANIVKCRPPQNRIPTDEEISSCRAFLLKQIEIVKPKIIVALGGTSYSYLTGDMDSSISKVRGEFISFGSSKLMPTFHPAYLLRNPSVKREIFNDMLKIKAML